MNNFRSNHAMQTTGNAWLQGKLGIGRGDFSFFLDWWRNFDSESISWNFTTLVVFGNKRKCSSFATKQVTSSWDAFNVFYTSTVKFHCFCSWASPLHWISSKISVGFLFGVGFLFSLNGTVSCKSFLGTSLTFPKISSLFLGILHGLKEAKL